VRKTSQDTLFGEAAPAGGGSSAGGSSAGGSSGGSAGGKRALSLVSAALLINWARVVKSEREVAALRVAGKIADAVMMRAALGTVTAGGLQAATAGAALSAQAHGVTLAQADGRPVACGGGAAAVWPTVASGVDATAAHLPWSRSGRYSAGQGTFLELSGVYKRYTVPIARSCFVVAPAPAAAGGPGAGAGGGKPGAGAGPAPPHSEQEQARKRRFEVLHAAVAEALAAAVACCREGQRACAVYHQTPSTRCWRATSSRPSCRASATPPASGSRRTGASARSRCARTTTLS
jgi:Xaa-Pro aminopeptidase